MPAEDRGEPPDARKAEEAVGQRSRETRRGADHASPGAPSRSSDKPPSRETAAAGHAPRQAEKPADEPAKDASGDPAALLSGGVAETPETPSAEVAGVQAKDEPGQGEPQAADGSVLPQPAPSLPAAPGTAVVTGQVAPAAPSGPTSSEQAQPAALNQATASALAAAGPAASLVRRAGEDARTGPDALPTEGGPASFAADLSAVLPATAGPTAHGSAASGALAPAAPAVHGAATTPVSLGAVPVEIGLRSLQGSSSFEVRLDPAELGRIDVRLDIDDEGTVRAHLTVDRVETLSLLQRDARSLERAFEQAGLKPSEGGIDYALRDQNTGRGGHGQSGNRTPPGESAPAARDDVIPALPPERLLRRGVAGIDLRI